MNNPRWIGFLLETSLKAKRLLIFGICTPLAFSGLFSAHAQAPSADWGKVVASAKREGVVNFYLAQVMAARLVQGFQRAYPDIRVNFNRGPSGQLLPKIEQERATGVEGADVFATTEKEWLQKRANEGQLLKPIGPALAGYPSKYVLDRSIVITALEPIVILYNKKEVSGNPPRGYQDLLRPDFKGRIGTSEITSSLVVAWYDWLEKTQGSDYLARLKAQAPKLYTASVPASQATASGEIAVTAFSLPSAAKPLVDAGAPVDYFVPNPAFGTEHVVGALSWGKHPNAALVFVDWLMSVDGQAAWVGKGESASVRPGVPGSLPIDGIVPWNPSAYPPEAVAKYREKWTRIFKQ